MAYAGHGADPKSPLPGRDGRDGRAVRRLRLIGTTFRGRKTGELHALVAHLRRDLPHLLGTHGVIPAVDSLFDLAEADRAAERLTRPGLMGKVVLRIA